jgi:dihydrofolate reductase
MSVKMILATGINGELGYSDGRLAFSCKEDMRYFKEQTLNHNVVVGRKTFDSIGLKNGLPNRNNYVVTRSPDSTRKALVGQYTLESMKDLINIFESMGYKDTFIIGGKEIYTQMVDMVDQIHHTVIRESNPEADIVMDMSFLQEGDWVLDSAKELSDNATVFIWKRKEF